MQYICYHNNVTVMQQVAMHVIERGSEREREIMCGRYERCEKDRESQRQTNIWTDGRI